MPTISEFFEKYSFLKPFLLPIVIGGVGGVCVLVALFSFFTPHNEEPVSFQTQDVKGADVGNGFKPFPKVNSKQIIVDVEGAVARRGIYHLNANARVQDALEAAGGLSENADRTFVEKHINLAAKLVDGAKIYIPREGENVTVETGLKPVSTDVGVGDQSASVNINDATADQLDALPGIGQVTAQKIVSGRPYADVQDLLTKKIVSNSVFTKIKDKVSVY